MRAWALLVVPARADRLRACLQQLAHHILTPVGIAFTVDAPEAGAHPPICPESRRQTVLMFEEILTGIVEHSEADLAHIRVRIDGGSLVLEVAANGTGFDVTRGLEQRGLRSLRRRAASVGGTVDLTSTPSDGIRVQIVVPLAAAGAAEQTRAAPGVILPS